MHSSNNVIRLGLTKKFKDKKNLLRLVDYQHGSLDILNRGVKHQTRSDVSSPNLVDFKMDYSTEFDHLFRVNVILRDGRPSCPHDSEQDLLFYLKNSVSMEGLFDPDLAVESTLGILEKDCIILNMGAPILLGDAENGIEEPKYTLVIFIV